MKLNVSCDAYKATVHGNSEGCNCARSNRRWRKRFMMEVKYITPVQRPTPKKARKTPSKKK